MDDLELNTGSGGETLATDQAAGGEHYQQVKLIDPTADSTSIVGVPGNGVHGAAMRVTIASDSSGQVKLAVGSAAVGTVEVDTFQSTGSTSPFHLEDQASAGGDMGSFCLARRTSTPADQSGTDGDYEGLQMDNGRLWTATAGGVAHDSAYSENPLPIGAIAYEMDGTAPGTAVAELDLTRLKSDLDGRLLTNTSHPASGSYNLETSSAQTATEAVAAPSAGFSIYLTHVFMSAITAQTAWLHDEDDNVVFPLQYFGANTGIVSAEMSGNPIRLTHAKALEFTSTAGIAHSLLIQYFVGP